MKTTGIIRRIDDLGRLVIPREIRKSLQIKEGQPLEMVVMGGLIIVGKADEGEVESEVAE